MSNLKNKVQLIGYLGKDTEVKETSSGKSMARTTIAISESYRNSRGEKVTETYWHTLVFWGAQAEFAARYLKKGTEVAVEGKLVSRSYEDNSGRKVYVTEVVVNEVVFMNSKREQDKKAA